MNFLYQASHLILNGDSQSALGRSCRRIVATHLSHLQVGIGRKAVFRSSIDVKRTICKGCHVVLLPGKTSKTVVDKSPKQRRQLKRFATTCLQCGLQKSIPVDCKIKSDDKKLKNLT
jgi:RNase P subunit RPR2